MEKLGSMMQRVGAGVSKKSAENVARVWKAIRTADFSEAGTVKLLPTDYTAVYKYLQACAKKAGLL